MIRAMMLSAVVAAVAACTPDAEESTTAEELLENEDSVIRAGTVAPDSVSLRGDSAIVRDSALMRDSVPMRDTGVRPDPIPRT
jgi:hypothetical protein